MRPHHEIKVELNGQFLGYLKNPQDIPRLLADKGVKADQVKDVRFSSVTVPSLTMQKNAIIAIHEAVPVQVSKRRGRKKKTETPEPEKVSE